MRASEELIGFRADIWGVKTPREVSFSGSEDTAPPVEGLFFWVVEFSETLRDSGGKLVDRQGQHSKHEMSKDLGATAYANHASAKAVFETRETALCR